MDKGGIILNRCLERIVRDYSTSEILHVCRTLNKDYNIYDTDKVRWNKIAYALYKTAPHEIEELQKTSFSNEATITF